MISPNTEAPSLLIQLNYSKNNIDKNVQESRS